MDDEISAVISGWVIVFFGGACMIVAVIFGSTLGGLLGTVVMSGGILILVYGFVRWRVPEIINFFKTRGWENEWTRSLGL